MCLPACRIIHTGTRSTFCENKTKNTPDKYVSAAYAMSGITMQATLFIIRLSIQYAVKTVPSFEVKHWHQNGYAVPVQQQQRCDVLTSCK